MFYVPSVLRLQISPEKSWFPNGFPFMWKTLFNVFCLLSPFFLRFPFDAFYWKHFAGIMWKFKRWCFIDDTDKAMNGNVVEWDVMFVSIYDGWDVRDV